MRVALLQTDIAWNDPTTNVTRCQKLAQQAISQGAHFLIFPEMFTSGFSMPTGSVAQESFEQGLEFLTHTAQEFGVHALGSLPQLVGERLFNTAVLISPEQNKQLTRTDYQKIHLFSYGEETALYSAGDRTASTNIEGVRCSISICYDLRFTIPFYQQAPRTDLYVIVANWPKTRREHWLTLLRARAIENQAYVAGVNRVGEGGGLSYSGDSVIFGPDGTQLTALSDQETVITCDIDAEKVAEWRATFPALKDRRPEVYGLPR